MHRMQVELASEGYVVDFVSVNVTTGIETAEQLVEQCAFPLLQDTEEIGVWGLLGGKKDDIYIFAADGELARALPVGGDTSTNLGDEDGYKNLKYALYDALDVELPESWPPEPSE
ncbi:MAG: hypothetical protein ACI9OJ_003362 [Myxococcota bacterium]|jgi:hypothetical protein